MMMMIAFTTFNSNLVPLIEGLCCSNPWEFECIDALIPTQTHPHTLMHVNKYIGIHAQAQTHTH